MNRFETLAVTAQLRQGSSDGIEGFTGHSICVFIG
jgi:hypothetical protein